MLDAFSHSFVHSDGIFPSSIDSISLSNEIYVSGTWKKINDKLIQLTPTVPLSKFYSMGESQSMQQFPKGTEEVDPMGLPYLDIQKGHFKMKKFFNSGEDIEIIPKFLLLLR
jgi:hypothetical protein